MPSWMTSQKLMTHPSQVFARCVGGTLYTTGVAELLAHSSSDAEIAWMTPRVWVTLHRATQGQVRVQAVLSRRRCCCERNPSLQSMT